MPIYEYKCSSCSKQFDLLQKMDATSVAQCPICLTDTAHRLVSAPSFQLKGDGWYVTDFKNKAPDPSVKSETASTEAATSQSESADTTKTKQTPSEKKASDSKPSVEPKAATAATQGETN